MPEPVNDYQSVEKAFRLLEQLGAGEARGVTELAEAVGLDKGAVSRMLKTLTALGYTEQQGPRGRYGIGPKILVLGRSYLNTADLRTEAVPIMAALALAARATAVLVVPAGNQVVIAWKCNSPEKVQVASAVGDVLVPHASASGRVILSERSSEDRELLLESPLRKFTPHTITDSSELDALFARVARDGYAIERGEEDVSVACIAAPVRDESGTVIAALAITGPIVGTPFSVDDDHVCMVRAAALELSGRLGFIAREAGVRQ